jgi:hypothetical protein
METKTKTITNVPANLEKWIEEQAKMNRRSWAAEALMLIEEAQRARKEKKA